MTVDSKSYEQVKTLKYLDFLTINANSIHEKIMFFPRTRSCARIYYEFIYNLHIVDSELFMCYWKTELGESYQGLLELMRAH